METRDTTKQNLIRELGTANELQDHFFAPVLNRRRSKATQAAQLFLIFQGPCIA
ncbi:Hypothetical predicted protein [Podarcis lilfordi]|uniref:Uncharacterized protein n=1 Tax=Podarcis lilfordi TaxID=74358 RepID=A0AA35NXR0_9SAUR|nr:Hypothetical predicted protein [Podarcis lilfordi]